jgi:hypothetical protein
MTSLGTTVYRSTVANTQIHPLFRSESLAFACLQHLTGTPRKCSAKPALGTLSENNCNNLWDAGSRSTLGPSRRGNGPDYRQPSQGQLRVVCSGMGTHSQNRTIRQNPCTGTTHKRQRRCTRSNYHLCSPRLENLGKYCRLLCKDSGLFSRRGFVFGHKFSHKPQASSTPQQKLSRRIVP